MVFRPMNMMASGGGGSGALFVNSTVVYPSSNSELVVPPAGALVGDLMFILVPFSEGTASISGGAGGWIRDDLNWTNYGYVTSVFRKALASGDMAGVTVNAYYPYNSYPVVAYRGPSAATLKSSTPGGTGSTLSLSGFTKSVSSQGLVTLGTDRDGAAPSAAVSGFTKRVSSTSGTSIFGNLFADLLVPGSYTNGAAVTWTGLPVGFDQVGFLYELT